MMKVLLINGSPNAKGCTYTALTEVASTLEAEGIKTELIHASAAENVIPPENVSLTTW